LLERRHESLEKWSKTVRAAVDRDDDAEDLTEVRGTVREVVYVGSGTRYVVDLEVGGSLVAFAQNQRSTSMEVMGMRGRRVRLVWRKEHEYRVG
jgi:putative spermidine/putrescine transport system ATP-binding protein